MNTAREGGREGLPASPPSDRDGSHLTASAGFTPPRATIGSSSGDIDAVATSVYMRGKSGAPSSHSNNFSYRNMLLLEKKRKAHEVAVDVINHGLLEETLADLRKKAQDLQNDKWMYEDVRI